MKLTSVLFKVLGFIASLAMFATLPASAESKAQPKKQVTAKAVAAASQAGANNVSEAASDDHPTRYRLDDFYEDLKLPPRQQ